MSRLTARALAEALGISTAVARAIAEGEIPDCGVVTYWPTGGNIYLGDDASLARWRTCRDEVERFGVDAVWAAEDRERKARRP